MCGGGWNCSVTKAVRARVEIVQTYYSPTRSAITVLAIHSLKKVPDDGSFSKAPGLELRLPNGSDCSSTLSLPRVESMPLGAWCNSTETKTEKEPTGEMVSIQQSGF